uniref:Alpha-galactosidase n=1 Tax=Plectus sambesii TaxID=2011161 RepID=A0A914VZT5_9BILA
MLTVLFTLSLLAVWLPHVSLLDNGLAKTPPMGWMSWAQFYCEIDCLHHPYSCISEDLYMEMATRLVEDGYKDVGYNSIHIDDCWLEMNRSADGKLVADRVRFQSGILALSNYMHERGLKLGLYEDYGTKTCAGYPGSYGYMEMDANTFAEWGVDYFKFDGCYMDAEKIPQGYKEMSAWINKTGHSMVYSCEWPLYLLVNNKTVDYAEVSNYCNLWRNYYDVSASWNSIHSIINFFDLNQDKLIPVTGPGRWNDPDMIVVGQNSITPDQSRTQMSIWSIWSAPLIMSNDLRLVAPVYKEILQNRRVIAIDQDPLGKMGRLVVNTTNVAVYVKSVTPTDENSSQSSFAVVIFNRHLKSSAKVTVRLNEIGLTNSAGYFVQDLWSGEKRGIMLPDDQYIADVPPTGVNMFKATLTQADF